MNLAASAVFWILVGLSVTTVIIFVERFIELRRSQIDWQDFLKGVINVLEAGYEDEALAICDDTPVPVTKIVATAIRNRNSSALALREAVDTQGRAEIARLDRRLSSLSIISHIAPLLGLMGVLIGFAKTIMIVDLNEVVLRSELISSANSAIVSAILGLAVAIPAAVMYALLRLKKERLTVDLEAAATHIVGYMLSKGQQK